MIGSVVDRVKVVADAAMVGQHAVVEECMQGVSSKVGEDMSVCSGLWSLINPEGASICESWNIWFFGILLSLVLFCSMFRRWKRIVDWLSSHILGASILVLIVGFMLYNWGYYNPALEWYSVVPRSIVSSFKMFVVMHDLARVDKSLFTNNFYMACFSITHFLAALLTFLMIFKLVGFRLFSSMRLWGLGVKFWFAKNIGIFTLNQIHVFWGINDESLMLAESIDRIRKSRGSDIVGDKIIFVNIVEDSADVPHQKATLGSVIDIITLKNSEMERLDKIGALVDNCHSGPASVVPVVQEGQLGGNGERSSDVEVVGNLFGTLRLRRLRRIVKRAKSVKFYLFSEDERQNVLGAMNLQNDKTVKSRDKVMIYVHARKAINAEMFDIYNHYVEEEKSTQPSVKIVDSAFKSVKQLRDKGGWLPVDCLSYKEKDGSMVDCFSPTGLVNTPFISLIVGFNATGQEAFKFLYEHGTFISEDKSKTPFKCYAVDQNMSAIEGIITSKIGHVIKTEELELISTEVNSKVFWDKVESIINDLNYTVIALNNDELGLQLAVNIFKMALRKRSSKMPLKIALRCYDDANLKMMNRVCENLNQSIKESEINLSIAVFGDQSKIFNYGSVLSDYALRGAKEYNWEYAKTSGDGCVESAEEQWNKSFGKDAVAKQKNKAESHGSEYHAKYELLCKIEQNFANVAHAKTKLRLMGVDKDRTKLETLLNVVGGRKAGHTDYKCSNTEYAELLHNMALLEHERFISARHLKGFVYGVPKDSVKKHHDCLCPMSQLNDERIRSYDNNVIDTTIRLESERRKKMFDK